MELHLTFRARARRDGRGARKEFNSEGKPSLEELSSASVLRGIGSVSELEEAITTSNHCLSSKKTREDVPRDASNRCALSREAHMRRYGIFCLLCWNNPLCS